MAWQALAAGAAIGIGKDIYDYGKQQANNATNLEWAKKGQRELGDIRNEQQLSLISRSPQAYMSGLEQAGLNPLLATGAAPNMSGGTSAQQAAYALQDPTKQAKASAQQTKNFIYFLRALKKL